MKELAIGIPIGAIIFLVCNWLMPAALVPVMFGLLILWAVVGVDR